MRYKIFSSLLFVSLCSNIIAQPQPIKVFLLGTFHFGQTDTALFDIKTTENQIEVMKLCKTIEGFKPDKVFVERQPDFEHQTKLDSLYKAYCAGDSLRRRNEIWQVAFRVASILGHDSIYQCDHPGRYGSIMEELTQYAEKNNQLDILEGKRNGTTVPLSHIIDRDSLYRNSSLLGILKILNSAEYQNSSHAHYINIYPQIGNTDAYHYDADYMLGASLTTDWYRRNILIYTKMINQLTYHEKAIFLIIGNDHIPIIRQLFIDNPYFEVIDTITWLNEL
jgi:hypothetical protein